MKRVIGAAIYHSSQFLANIARRLGYRPPQTEVSVWNLMAQTRMGVLLMTKDALEESLKNRPRHGRMQAEDNQTVAPLSVAINGSIERGNYRLAAEVFRDNYAQILNYEKMEPACEVHKGALAFDVARAYLQSWDFFAAMHYFELSQHETRETTNDKKFSIYSFDLFEKNFWEAVEVDTTDHPITIYEEFWGTPYNKANALDDYAEMSDDSKLAYIIASAERVRLQHIAKHSGWEGSDALRLGYWTLATDIARFLEIETKLRFKTKTGASPKDTLLACLEQGFHSTPIGDVSKEVAVEIPKTYPRKDGTGAKSPAQLYEDNFDLILKDIRDNTKNREHRIYLALYLLGFSRNQIAHGINKQSKLFMQLNDAKFLVDVFLCLCRTKEWKGQ